MEKGYDGEDVGLMVSFEKVYQEERRDFHHQSSHTLVAENWYSLHFQHHCIHSHTVHTHGSCIKCQEGRSVFLADWIFHHLLHRALFNA